MNIIFIIIATSIGMAFWLFGVVLSIMIILDGHKAGKVIEGLKCIPAILIICGVIGTGFNLGSFIMPVKNIKTHYEKPIVVLKTNDIVMVNYMDYDIPCMIYFTDTSYWNSTNIRVEVESGQNIWGYDVKEEYRVVR